jgi:hypothetical protein
MESTFSRGSNMLTERRRKQPKKVVEKTDEEKGKDKEKGENEEWGDYYHIPEEEAKDLERLVRRGRRPARPRGGRWSHMRTRAPARHGPRWLTFASACH